jgi:hypothetical protein
MSLPNEEQYSELSEFEQQMQASHWSMLFLLAETAAGFHVLVDRLTEKGVLDVEDSKAMDEALTHVDYMQSNYMHIQKAFQEKYTRVRYAALNPDEVTEYVESKKAGKDVKDPLKSRTDRTAPGDNGPIPQEV